MTAPPPYPKIYHIVHIDRLPSIIGEGYLWCDAEINRNPRPGTAVGSPAIKRKRLTKPLISRSGLCVGDCVPFYFCPRSVMLFVIYKQDPDLPYRGGQDCIVHLEADMRKAVAWAEKLNMRWAFTLSNASASDSEVRCDLAQLGEINWDAVQARYFVECKKDKQAEFLVEYQFPWWLVSRIGVISSQMRNQTLEILANTSGHPPIVEIRREWYY